MAARSKPRAAAGPPPAAGSFGDLASSAATAAAFGFAPAWALLGGLAAATCELLDFWHERIGRYCELGGRLAACRSLEEALQIQDAELQELIRAYLAIGPRLAAPFVDAMARSGGEPAVERPPSRHARAA